MIGSLRGTVLERSADGHVLLEVSGVGYVVHVAPRTLAELEPTSTAFVHVHHHIREGDQTLYGFLTRDERATFQDLIGAHGVGPALAMAILATHPPATLVDLVANGDVAALTMVPGVGKKTAERLLVELKGRLALPTLEATGDSGVLSDLREALIGLGYAESEIREVMRDIPDDLRTSRSTEDMLRHSLSQLAARRA
ncbi:MAG: Holliday junction branch migration protein RuvA [Ilumatobacteraceae bacterium]|jgi:Holliday junction DNA helicase RuvA|nr:Holliday junction branch migration protein RuvA [Actinomycetota bacterium]MDA3011134.1 Holliday junction branch migration protein RuvA [Actinomycetota bacterium]MDA3023941.1 Holliday junction branch migration protein RuvA [Actinomycetota bacterium]NBU55492.1 Holliday junction branch migration protein RuvA [Acidimicrobiia bacterium]